MNDQATQAPEANKLQDALNAVTPRHLTLGLGGLSAIIVVVSTCSALSVDMNALPPPRKAPPSLEASSVFNDRYKKGFYQGQLDDDCKRYKIRRITIDALKGGNPYAVEYTGSQVLRSTKKLETSSLRLTAVTRKLLIGEEGRGIRAKHLALRIENLTDKFLAYRVTTKVWRAKLNKANLSHNALTLKPKQSIVRTECLQRHSSTLTIKKVEALELTRLGYYYVSRLAPLRLGFSKRTSVGHNFGGFTPCKLLPWRLIQRGIRSGTTRWYDVVDFYSRHNCGEYSFFEGYQWSLDGVNTLPAKKPPKEKAKGNTTP